MKYQTTAKAIRAEHAPCNILPIGYCDDQFFNAEDKESEESGE